MANGYGEGTPWIERPCPVCAKIYRAHPPTMARGHGLTCSSACRMKQNRIELSCTLCGEAFSLTHYRATRRTGPKFCSHACAWRGRAAGLVPEKPHPRPGASLAVLKSNRDPAINAKRMATRRANGGYVVSDAQKAQLSLAAAAQLRNNHAVVSALEKTVAQHLDGWPWTYQPQYVVRDPLGRFAAVCDFYFPTLQAVIEVNGTYWHADPRIYQPEMCNAMQRDHQRKYDRKRQLLDSLGLHLIEIWELDLDGDVLAALAVAHARLRALEVKAE